MEYSQDDLEFFAAKLRKPGRYQVNSLTSTPGAEAQETFNDTPTHVREYNRKMAATLPNLETDSASKQPDPTSSQLPTYSPATPPHTPPSSWYSCPNSSGISRLDYIHPRIPELPPFSGDGKSNTNMFEIWRYDVNCFTDEGVYPTPIREAIRKSLKGTARGVLLHLGENETISDILTELEGVYGNVQSSERLNEQFYSEHQQPDESIADYSLR